MHPLRLAHDLLGHGFTDALAQHGARTPAVAAGKRLRPLQDAAPVAHQRAHEIVARAGLEAGVRRRLVRDMQQHEPGAARLRQRNRVPQAAAARRAAVDRDQDGPVATHQRHPRSRTDACI
jgi:hypothetical protein